MENYEIVPILAAKYSTNSSGEQILLEPSHEFSPPFMSAFLGDGIDYISNYNFNDVSSFDLSGNNII